MSFITLVVTLGHPREKNIQLNSDFNPLKKQIYIKHENKGKTIFKCYKLVNTIVKAVDTIAYLA